MFKVVSEAVRADYEAVSRVSEAFLAAVDCMVCPVCQTAIECRERVGWCVYARPCGCRLFAGQRPDEERYE